MKTLLKLLFVIALAMFMMPTMAQTTSYGNEKITVKTSDLTPDQLARIKAEQDLEIMEKKMEQYGKWVGVGGEVGQAINEGLMAVVDVSDKFGKTDVGKFTLVMVGWKVMGKDIVRILLGFIFIVVYMWVLIFSYKNSFKPKRILKLNPGLFKYPKEYEIYKPKADYEGVVIIKILYLGLVMAGFGITFSIMFGGA